MRAVFILTAAVLAASCASGPPVAEAPGPSAIPERELGLSRAEVLSEPPPGPVLDNPAEPGEAELRPPAFTGAPPVIPHSVSDLGPIRIGDNACLGCHDRETAGDFGATAVPESHYVDQRNGDGSARDEVAGARYTCTTCHVAQTLAEPLVGNAPR